MNAPRPLLVTLAVTVAGALIAQWLLNNVRAVRRAVGGL